MRRRMRYLPATTVPIMRPARVRPRSGYHKVLGRAARAALAIALVIAAPSLALAQGKSPSAKEAKAPPAKAPAKPGKPAKPAAEQPATTPEQAAAAPPTAPTQATQPAAPAPMS